MTPCFQFARTSGFSISSKSNGFLRRLAAVVVACSLGVCAEAQEPGDIEDPFEGYNRAIFSFNDTVDVYVLEPVARGWDFVVPDPVQNGLENFFSNIRTPVYLVSDLIQLKPKQFATHTARFMINTTVGLAGFIDVAEELELKHIPADFGIALGYNGVGPGPYFVIPILGPSTIRDTFGRIVDAFLNPMFYTGTVIDDPDPFWVSAAITTVEIINTRASLLDAVGSAKEASLDYYGFLRSAYVQLRQKQIKGVAAGDDAEFDFGDDTSFDPPGAEAATSAAGDDEIEDK